MLADLCAAVVSRRIDAEWGAEWDKTVKGARHPMDACGLLA